MRRSLLRARAVGRGRGRGRGHPAGQELVQTAAAEPGAPDKAKKPKGGKRGSAEMAGEGDGPAPPVPVDVAAGAPADGGEKPDGHELAGPGDKQKAKKSRTKTKDRGHAKRPAVDMAAAADAVPLPAGGPGDENPEEPKKRKTPKNKFDIDIPEFANFEATRLIIYQSARTSSSESTLYIYFF